MVSRGLGWEVIHEETESQISSDSDQELDCLTEFCSETIRQRKPCASDKSKHTVNGNGNMSDSSASTLSTLESVEDSKSITEDIIVKHVRIPSNWDPVSSQIAVKIYFIF